VGGLELVGPGGEIGGRLLPLDGYTVIKLPSHKIANTEFRNMAREGLEWKSFLRSARGCSNLIDLGASAGFFSALFSVTRSSPARILSVEFDTRTLPVLEETRLLNARAEVEWIIDDRGVTDTPGPLVVISTGYGASIADDWSVELARAAAKSNQMPLEHYIADGQQLSDICASHRFIPDLVKIDIEGYEYEVVLSSQSFLREHKPRLHLELHLELLRMRRKNVQELYRCLRGIGYRLSEPRAKRSSMKNGSSCSTVRLGLEVPRHFQVPELADPGKAWTQWRPRLGG
jgi:FkbM family methyltransferase